MPPGGQNEDARFTSAVSQMLAALHKRNEAGLVMSRPSRQRPSFPADTMPFLLAAIF
ncbi:MAG: hypothetical protein KF770_21875 [Anaerolineae bacterium]|nr:hypothetical protein [Anaerolineae bacterium]